MASRFTLLTAAFLVASPLYAQTTSNNPFESPINATDGVIAVNYTEFAAIPDINGQAPRMMLLVDEPGTRRMFVNAMQGPLFSVSYDGKTVTEYVNINAPEWGVNVNAQGNERGFQSFAFHPEFGRAGSRGYGRFYTYTDTSNMPERSDFKPSGPQHTHDTVLLEWTAKNPAAATYDGAAPRELFRAAQPFANHNGGHIAFNPLAAPGRGDYGLLYIGLADGGSGGDPLKHAQNLASAFGKILRIDPLGTNSANAMYGIPADNPFASDGKDDTLGEIFAYGLRNPQRLGWDPKNGNMFVADIGQGTVEKVSLFTRGANLGWNTWEGSFTFADRQTVGLANRRDDAAVTYPVAEYDHRDPLLTRPAVTGVYVLRQGALRPLLNKLLFGDNPSGEVFYVDADNLPKGGQDPIRRVLFNDGGTQKKLLDLIKEKNAKQGRTAPTRADLRMGLGPNNRFFLLNKRDGVVREIVP